MTDVEKAAIIEREECAKIADKAALLARLQVGLAEDPETVEALAILAEGIAAAIRGRGQ